MSSPIASEIAANGRSWLSRLASGAIFAGAGFLVGISVFSLAIPLTSAKAGVIKLAMDGIVAFVGFLIGLLLSRRAALWGLGIAVATAIPTLQGVFATRSHLEAIANNPATSSSSAGAFLIAPSDIPRPVAMSQPDDFSLASTPKEKARRYRLLNFFRQNPAYKGSYEEVLLCDWSQDNARPQIVISTMQAARGDQGAIGPAAWAEPKKQFETSNIDEIKRLREEFRSQFRHGSPVGFSFDEAAFSTAQSPDPNTVVLLSRNRLQAAGNIYDGLSARKIIYHNGYLVTVDVIVSDDGPDALTELQKFVGEVRIREIQPG